jgi:biopolymer transport protein ExbB
MKRLTIIIAGLLFMTGVAQAQESASTMDALLEQIERGQARDSAEARQREQRFAQARNEQQNLLNQARQERARQERNSERLEQLFEDNQARIVAARQALDERLGALKELFGVLQTVSGDAQGRFNESLTSIQYPDREAFLVELGGKMAGASSLPSIEEIERLWYELQREVTESGRIVKFNHEITKADGEVITTDVVRVGPFNIVYEDGYLRYNPTSGSVSELTRQPEQGRYTNSTADLVEATSGPVTFGIDGTRGSILALLVESPTVGDRLRQGGIVGYCIMGLGMIGLLIALWRAIGLSTAGRKVSAQLKRDTASTDNPLGRVLAAYEANRGADTESVEGDAGSDQGPVIYQGNFRGRTAHGPARNGDRHDQDLPGNHTVWRRRPEDDGRGYFPGTYDDSTWTGRGNSDGTYPYAGQWPEPQDHQYSPVTQRRTASGCLRRSNALAN